MQVWGRVQIVLSSSPIYFSLMRVVVVGLNSRVFWKLAFLQCSKPRIFLGGYCLDADSVKHLLSSVKLFSYSVCAFSMEEKYQRGKRCLRRLNQRRE